MQRKYLLLIQGKNNAHPSFFLRLQKKGFDADIVATGASAIEKIRKDPPLVVVIDATSLRTSGSRIMFSLKKSYPTLPVILIIEKGDTPLKTQVAPDVLLEMPFALHKLINRIKRYFPSTDSAHIHTDRLEYFPEKRCVIANGKVSSLTPRTAAILDMLIANCGETVGRKEIFKKVWDTNFVDDMRSLDVHICWLREAVEVNPQNPCVLITVRGKGYRLDVAEPTHHT